LLVDQQQVARKSVTDLLTVLRGNYLLNFCSKKEQEMWKGAVESSSVAFPVHFRILMEVLMSPV